MEVHSEPPKWLPIPVAPPRLQRRVCRLVRALDGIVLALAQREPSGEELLGQGADLALTEVALDLEAVGEGVSLKGLEALAWFPLAERSGLL